MKKIAVIFSPEAQEVYSYLSEKAKISKPENMILKSLRKKIELIKSNVHYGEPIAKRLIPKEYKNKYGVSNLFRVELPLFWRILYTLTNGESEIEIVAFILDVMDHDDYDDRFGYKGK